MMLTQLLEHRREGHDDSGRFNIRWERRQRNSRLKRQQREGGSLCGCVRARALQGRQQNKGYNDV